MSNKPVTEALKKALADTYLLQIKTQNYHWNVEGPGFSSLHALFQTQYEELFLAVDVIAERIRALGEKAPGSYNEFTKLSKLKDGNNELEADAMVLDLYNSNQHVIHTLQKLLATGEKASDAPTVDIATQRLAVHEKASWMLKSSLPKGAKLKVAV